MARCCLSARINWINLHRASIGARGEDDHQAKEEVAGRVPEEGVEPVQSRHGESLLDTRCHESLATRSILDDISERVTFVAIRPRLAPPPPRKRSSVGW